MQKEIDKRKNARRVCSVLVEGREGTPFAHSQTIDISQGGVGFISPKAISVDTKIPIELSLSPENESVVVVGRVKWVRKLSESNNYRVGLVFDDFIDGSASLLNKYCVA